LNEVCKSKEVFIKSGYEMLKIIYMKIQQDWLSSIGKYKPDMKVQSFNRPSIFLGS
jgi:hypothetical protein